MGVPCGVEVVGSLQGYQEGGARHNPLGFTPDVQGSLPLEEVAHRLDIGYTINDREDRKYQKPT